MKTISGRDDADGEFLDCLVAVVVSVLNMQWVHCSLWMLM